jgi:hypothetical protein
VYFVTRYEDDDEVEEDVRGDKSDDRNDDDDDDGSCWMNCPPPPPPPACGDVTGEGGEAEATAVAEGLSDECSDAVAAGSVEDGAAGASNEMPLETLDSFLNASSRALKKIKKDEGASQKICLQERFDLHKEVLLPHRLVVIEYSIATLQVQSLQRFEPGSIPQN